MSEHFPAKFSAQFYYTDGNTIATAGYDFPVTKLPTKEDIDKAREAINEQLPEGFRPLDFNETVNHWLREERGHRGPDMAIPPLKDGENWNK